MTINSVEQACKQLIYEANGAQIPVTINDNPFTATAKDLGTQIGMGLPIAGLFVLPYKQIGKSTKAFFKADSGNHVSAWKEAWKNAKPVKPDLSHLNTIGERKTFQQVSAFESYMPKAPKGNFKDLKSDAAKQKYHSNAKKYNRYSKVRKLIQEAKSQKLTGARLQVKLRQIDQAFAEAKLAEHRAVVNGQIKPTSAYGKAKHWVKGKSGYYKVKGKLLEKAVQNNKTGKLLRGAGKFTKFLGKCGKGWPIMAGLTLFSAVPACMSAFAIDKHEQAQGKSSNRGMKEVKKQGIKFGTNILAYAAGSAATGAAIGTIFPGVGNIVGGILGFVGGCAAAFLADKATGAAWDYFDRDGTGKSTYDRTEQQIYSDAQAEKQSNSADYQEYALQAIDSMMGEDGKLKGSKDALEAYEYLLAQAEQEEQQTSVQETTVQQAAASPQIDSKVQELHNDLSKLILTA